MSDNVTHIYPEDPALSERINDYLADLDIILGNVTELRDDLGDLFNLIQRDVDSPLVKRLSKAYREAINPLLTNVENLIRDEYNDAPTAMREAAAVKARQS